MRPTSAPAKSVPSKPQKPAAKPVKAAEKAKPKPAPSVAKKDAAKKPSGNSNYGKTLASSWVILGATNRLADGTIKRSLRDRNDRKNDNKNRNDNDKDKNKKDRDEVAEVASAGNGGVATSSAR